MVTIKHAHCVDHTIFENYVQYNFNGTRNSYVQLLYLTGGFETLPYFVRVASGARGSVGFSYSVAGMGSGSLCLMCLRLRRYRAPSSVSIM